VGLKRSPCLYLRPGESWPQRSVVWSSDFRGRGSGSRGFARRRAPRWPHILVGNSIGGGLVRVFADKHPEDVAGMVLVDAAYPDMGPRLMADLPPASAGEPEAVALWRQLFTWISDSSEASYPNPEGWDTQASHAQVRAAVPLGDLPLVVISQSPDKTQFLPSIPSTLADTNAGLQQTWKEMRQELVGLSSSGSQVIAAQPNGNCLENHRPCHRTKHAARTTFG
jgi:pimeloyl-ACP methyl ester carboxylesterase